jgi:NAD(P)-dependent dehydrogenase (short-subunit alcohol dehydrogenase family)
VVADRDGEGAAHVAQEIAGDARRVDVAREGDVAALIEHTETAHGPIALFCSNAGIGVPGGAEVANADWQRIWEINVMSHVYAARHLVPRMAKRGGGYLLNTASAAGLLTQIGSAPYAVTKHAAVAFAEWVAVTHGRDGIKVSVLCPQAVRTAMTASNPDGVASVDGMIEAEEVAEAVTQALAEERFLVLPHPEVATYIQRKAGDYDRWIRGMQRLREKYEG